MPFPKFALHVLSMSLPQVGLWTGGGAALTRLEIGRSAWEPTWKRSSRPLWPSRTTCGLRSTFSLLAVATWKDRRSPCNDTLPLIGWRSRQLALAAQLLPLHFSTRWSFSAQSCLWDLPRHPRSHFCCWWPSCTCSWACSFYSSPALSSASTLGTLDRQLYIAYYLLLSSVWYKQVAEVLAAATAIDSSARQQARTEAEGASC